MAKTTKKKLNAVLKKEKAKLAKINAVLKKRRLRRNKKDESKPSGPKNKIRPSKRPKYRGR